VVEVKERKKGVMFVIKHLSQRWIISETTCPQRLFHTRIRGSVLRAGTRRMGRLSGIAATLRLLSLSVFLTHPPIQAQVNNPRRRPRIGWGLRDVAFDFARFGLRS
jgi:hypothetical protein